MSNDLFDNYSTTAVPEDRTVSGLRIGMVNGSLAFAVPGLVTGLELGSELGFIPSVYVFLTGGFILSVLGIITGYVGQINRLTSCMTISCVFGRHGSIAMNLIIALSLLGWYGVNMDLFSSVVADLLQRWVGVSTSLMVIEILGGVLITATTVLGFHLMEKLATLLVPVMILVVAYMAHQVLQLPEDTLAQLMEFTPQTDLSFGAGVSVVVGSFIVGVVLMPDFTRFAANTKDTIVASVLPYGVLATLVYVVSAAAGIASANSDVLPVLQHLGLGASAFVLIVISAWLTNVVNLYSASLGINSVFLQTKEWMIIVACGVLGTLAASFNLLDRFIDFLFGLSVLFAPVAGVYIADFFFLRKQQRYEAQLSPKVSWSALLAWSSGLLVSLGSQAELLVFTGIQALDAALAAMIVYLVLKRLVPPK